MENRRSVPSMALILLVAYILCYGYAKRMLREMPVAVVQYVIRPMESNPNRAVETFLGNIFIYVLELQEEADHAASLKICAYITSMVYFHTVKLLGELLDLLNSRTYNSIMGRYDSLYLKADQIVLSIILFFVLIVVLFNVVLFYVFFLPVAVFARCFETMLDSVFSGYSWKARLRNDIQAIIGKRLAVRVLRGDLLHDLVCLPSNIS